MEIGHLQWWVLIFRGKFVMASYNAPTMGFNKVKLNVKCTDVTEGRISIFFYFTLDQFYFNLLQPGIAFLYPLKTSENL